MISVLTLASVAALAIPPGLPPLTAIDPINVTVGVNHIVAFTTDGRPATIVRARRENGNAHGYDVVLMAIDRPLGAHIAPVPELVEVEARDHSWSDTLRVETFDGENTLSAVRFVHARVAGAPATLLLEARRMPGTASALTDATPIQLDVWRLDGPRDVVGRTPDAFRLIASTTTTRRYCNADVALSKEVGVPLPDGDFEETADGCAPGTGGPLKSAAVDMIRKLDMTSFPNSIGPRRKPGVHTLAQYGFTSVASFDDGWAEARTADHNWTFRFLVLDNDPQKKRVCVADAAANGGTYHSVEAIDVVPEGGGLWRAARVVGQVPGCGSGRS